MALLDSILNLACLLLWLGWRSSRFDPLPRTQTISLAGTLRRADRARLGGASSMGIIAGILFLRAWVYWRVGPAAGWTPRLNLVIVVLPFRCDDTHFWSVLTFSLLSFVRLLIIFYFWVLLLIMLRGRRADSDPIQKVLRSHMGFVARWPWVGQLILPPVAVVVIWGLLHPLMVRLGTALPVRSNVTLFLQGFWLALCLYVSLKWVLAAFLLAHLVLSYVYLGTNPAWDFISAVARNLLRPIQRLPLRVGKMDFSPLAGAVLLLLILHVLPNYLLAQHIWTWLD